MKDNMIGCPEPFLTIAIPTFNRPQKVAQRLRELSLQLVPGLEVVVFENGATAETRDAVSPFLSSQVHYKPSRVNRGFTLNVLRCFEEARSTWVWILGDDDCVLPDSVKKAMEWLESCAGDVFVTSRPLSKWVFARVTVRDLDQLFAQTSFSEALFISATIWKREVVLERVDTFCDGGFSMGPQVAVMLKLMEREGNVATVYLDTLVNPKTDEHRWSRLRYMKRILTLFDIMETENGRRSLAKALLPAWNWAAIDALKEVNGSTNRLTWLRSFFSGRAAFRVYVGQIGFFSDFLQAVWKYKLRSKVRSMRRPVGLS